MVRVPQTINSKLYKYDNKMSEVNKSKRIKWMTQQTSDTLTLLAVHKT